MIQTTTDTNTKMRPRKRVRHVDTPMELLVGMIRDNADADHDTIEDLLWEMLLEDRQSRLLRRLVHDWINLNFNTAMRMAFPASPHEIGEAMRKRRQERERETVAIKAEAAAGLLDWKLPNGKPLRDCTFGECAEVGGWLSAISKHGKANEIVGAVLTEKAIRKIVSAV